MLGSASTLTSTFANLFLLIICFSVVPSKKGAPLSWDAARVHNSTLITQNETELEEENVGWTCG